MYRVDREFSRRLACVVLGSLLVSAASPAMAAGKRPEQAALFDLGSQDGSTVQLQLTIDKARTIGCNRAFTEVLVANPEIADVVTISNKQLYVLGKKAGTTNISLVGVDKRVLGVVRVEVAYDMQALTHRLSRLVPDGDITITSVGNRVLLSGTVKDSVSLSRAVAIAEQVAPGGHTDARVTSG